jgi:hypothetical protein
VTDEEAVKQIEAAACWLTRHNRCDCALGQCAKEPDPDALFQWRAVSAALGVPLSALLALATGAAVVAPRVLTEGMGAAADASALPTSRMLGHDFWQGWYASVLAASPFKPEGGA